MASEPTHFLPSSAIGIFDSGIGGLSVAKALNLALPSEDIVYVADSLHAPYGEKTERYVSDRCHRIVEFLNTKHIKLVVVACNTATLNCISELRSHFSVPFVGAEPGIKPALAASLTGTIGVMATQSTLESKKYQHLLDRFLGEHTVINQACNGLVERIEAADFDSDNTLSLLKKYLAPMLHNNADQIVLGCTHYGFLTPQINVLLAGRAQLINTSAAIARQASSLLQKDDLINPRAGNGEISVYSSNVNPRFEQTVKALWNAPLASIQPFTG